MVDPAWFGPRLKELRTAAELSLRELAEKVGITSDGIVKLERGARLPKWDTVLALCAALDVSTEEFRKQPSTDPAPTRGLPRKTPGVAQETRSDNGKGSGSSGEKAGKGRKRKRGAT